MTSDRKRALIREAAISLVLVACIVAILNAVLAHQRGELSTGWALAHAFQAAATVLATWSAGYVSRQADWQVSYWRDAYYEAHELYRCAMSAARVYSADLTPEERRRLLDEAWGAEGWAKGGDL